MAGYKDIVADFHHKNKEKLGPYPSFQMSKDLEPVLDMLSCKSTMLPELYA